MFSFIIGIVKFIISIVIMAFWGSWVIILVQIMWERKWENIESMKKLREKHPTVVEVVALIAGLITFLIGTAIAGALLIGIINF
jgi:hypothetical protein